MADKLKSDGALSRKLIGSRPRRTAIQLIVASVVVGAFLAFWGISPRDFWSGAFNFFKGIVGWLGESVGEVVTNLLTYLLFGAAIVVPVWLLVRVLNGGGNSGAGTRTDVSRKD